MAFNITTIPAIAETMTRPRKPVAKAGNQVRSQGDASSLRVPAAGFITCDLCMRCSYQIPKANAIGNLRTKNPAIRKSRRIELVAEIVEVEGETYYKVTGGIIALEVGRI
jgi:hypothetical protein